MYSRNLVDGTASATDTTQTEVIAAPGAGKRNMITTIIIANTSGTADAVNIKSASTTLMVLPTGADGAIINFAEPLKLELNEALNFNALTGQTTIYVSAVGWVDN
jgi:hypothetical protein